MMAKIWKTITLECQRLGIKHKKIKIKHPWTNDMVERFNQKIKNKVFRRYLFAGVGDLKERLINYYNCYML